MPATRAPDCPRERLIVDFSRGKLDEATTVAVAAHLETCVDCRSAVDRVAADSFMLRLRAAHVQSSLAAPTPGSLADSVSRANSGTVTFKPSAPQDSPSEAAKFSVPPELVDHPDYEVVKELGRGGMGVVYLARNRSMDRLEVLKVVSRSLLEQPGARERFQREIRSAAKLSHPNIVMAYSVPRAGDLLIYAMEYVEGQDLSKIIKQRGPLPVINAAYYAHQAALGLQHAHEQEMIHRDIKPGNLILSVQGRRHLVKILDFGLAKATSEKLSSTELTGSGQMLGTPDYMAPEQSLDAHQADIRADIYSLGCTLYYLLAGRPPFVGPSMYAVLADHHSATARPLSEFRADVPAELAAVVARMMAKQPADRFQTPAEASQALGPFFRTTGTDAAKLGALSDVKSPVAATVEVPPRPGHASDPFDPYHQWLGISPEERPVDYYRLLGAKRFEASPEVIANLADQRLTLLRTFQSVQHSPLAQRLLTEVSAARRCLLTADKKAAYDAQLRRSTSARPQQTLQIAEPAVESELDDMFTEIAQNSRPSAPTVTRKGPRRIAPAERHLSSFVWRYRIPAGIIGAALLGCIVILRGGLFKVRTEDGTIVLRVSQPDAEVLVDGQTITVQWGAGGKSAEITASPGKHRIEVKKQGFVASGREVRLDEGGREILTVALESDKRDAPQIVKSSAAERQTPRSSEPASSPSVPTPGASSGEAEHFVRLFNGKDLSGWIIDGDNKDGWSVEEDELVVRGDANVGWRHRNYLLTERDYSDYALRLEFSLETGAGSAIAIRAIPAEKLPYGNGNFFEHPIVNLTDKRNPPTGSMNWVFNGMNFVFSPAQMLPAGSWNRIEMKVQGNEMRMWVNGSQIVDRSIVPDARLGDGSVPGLCRTKGRIGLFRWDGTTRFRNVEVMELSSHGAPHDDVVGFGKPRSPDAISDHKPADTLNDPVFQQWMKGVAALPAQQQLYAVSKKLQELNPGFDGKLRLDARGNGVPRIDGGVVTELGLATDNVTDISPVRALAGLKALYCAGTPNTQRGRLSDLSPLQGMRLTKLDCGFTNVSDLSPLKGLPLTWLSCWNTPVFDLSALRGMRLTRLECASTQVSELSPLNGMPLRTLNCDETLVSDLSPLQGMSLHELTCTRSRISDLSPLKRMPLTRLWCGETQIADLSPLEGMPLESLACNRTQVSDVSPLKGIDLSELYVTPKNITKGVDALRRMKGLTTIGVEGDVKWPPEEFWKKYDAGDFLPWDNRPGFKSWLAEVAPLGAEKQLQRVAGKLQELNPEFDGKLTGFAGQGAPQIENGVVTELGFSTDRVTDISPVRALVGTKKLNCSGGWGRLSDLSPLKGMPLSSLSCAGTRVSDLSPLRGMPLTSLDCGRTFVADLSPVKEMRLVFLNCSTTSLADLVPLQGMPLTNLHCGTTRVSDLSPLRGMPLTELACDNTPLSDLSPLAGMSLTKVAFTPKNITNGLEIIRRMKSIETIGLRGDRDQLPAAEFWKKYDAGEFK